MNPKYIAYLCLFLCLPLVAENKKLKVFILAGQSNTVGHARAHTTATLFKTGEAKDTQLTKLIFKKDVTSEIDAQLIRAQEIDANNAELKEMDSGQEKTELEAKVKKQIEAHKAYKKRINESLVVSDRVYISSIADRNTRSGKLSFGYGADKEKIGPEYGFGLSIAEKVDGPILLIKTSWGGKSINYNFRPPSSGEYQLTDKDKDKEKNDDFKKNAGLNYRMMTEAVHDVLKNLKSNHPLYNEKAGYEIAGFVWFQGYNDQFDPEYRSNYKNNMINFIKDVRKEFQTPQMPFIVGVMGTNITKEKVDENEVSTSQRAAAKELGLKNNVLSVESYTEYSHYSYEVYKSGWKNHYHHWDTVGSDRPYHYLGSGAFFVRLGDSFASSMALIISKQKK